MASRRNNVLFRTILSGAILTTGLLFPGGPAQGQTTPCLGPNSTSSAFLSHLDSLFTMSDTGNVAWRTRLNIQPTTSNQIKLVTKKVTCQAAVAAVNSFLQHTTAGRTVYVFQAGPHYVVWDPTNPDAAGPGGALRRLMFFTSDWSFLSSQLY